MEQQQINRYYQSSITQSLSQDFIDRLESDPNSSLWFISFTFLTSRDQPIRGLGSSYRLFRYFDRLYVPFLDRLLGSKFNRPTKFPLQPMALVFLDVDASLREEQGWIVGPGSPLRHFVQRARSWNVGAQVPHLHCLFMVRGDVRDRFEGLMRDPQRFWSSIAEETHVPLRTSDTRRVVQPGDAKYKGDVPKVIDYVSKFLKNAPGRQDTTDFWNVWPTALSERKRKRNGMPYTKKAPTVVVPRGVTLKTPTLLTSNTA